jgi:hypothetical protein
LKDAAVPQGESKMLDMGQEEVQKLINQVAPARLANTVENAAAIASYVKSHNLPHNADSCLKAVNALLFVDGALTWDILPAKLASRTQHEAKIELKSAQQSNEEFTQKLRASEAADAKVKADNASITQAKELIKAYNPVKNNRFDAREQMDRQAEWTAALNQAIEKKRNLQEHVKALAETIQKRYRDREKASERI